MEPEADEALSRLRVSGQMGHWECAQRQRSQFQVLKTVEPDIEATLKHRGQSCVTDCDKKSVQPRATPKAWH